MTSRLAKILLTLALLFLPGAAHGQKFVHAYSSIGALNATFWIGQDAGFAKQEGLDTELVYIPSSSTLAQATLAGEAMISPANGQVIADVGLQGGELVAREEVGGTNAKAKQAKPQQLFDNSLVQEVVDEGFFVKLSGRDPQ